MEDVTVTPMSSTFIDVLENLRGRFVQLTLEYPIARIPGSTLPIARLLAVGSDYLVLDHVIVDGMRLHALELVFVRTGQVFAVAPVRLEEMLVELALDLPREGSSTVS